MIETALETGATNIDLALRGIDSAQRQMLYTLLQTMQRNLLDEPQQSGSSYLAGRLGPVRAAERFG
jgi:hypothetical protein